MNLGDLLQYDRVAILHGEIWRLITGHFVHWTPAHFAWDFLAFIVLGVLCVRRRGLFVAAVLATALTVSLFLLVCCPEIAAYRGLSAIDSALWIWSVFFIAEHRRPLAFAMLTLFVAKVMIESAGDSIFAAGVTLVPVVHLIGAFAGFGAAVAEHKMRLRRDAALHGTQPRDRFRRRRDESAVVGRVA